MSTKTNIPRRQFLRGAAGFTLPLPFLPSVAATALAQPRSLGRKYFVALPTGHGGLRPENMFPPESALTDRYELYPGHQVAYGPLKRTVDGMDAFLSPVLRARSSALTDRLVSKMNVLQGFNYSFNIVHHKGYLGNWAANNGSDADQKLTVKFPSIDQVMAWSPSFYRDLSGIRERVMLWQWGNTASEVSYNYSNPADRSGPIQGSRAEQYIGRLFDKIFVPASAPTAPSRKPIVDRVLEGYRSLRNGNRRLSSGDRQRLDDHMGRIAELQRRLSVRPTGSCSLAKPNPRGTSTGGSKEEFKAFVDIVVAGIICGTSRIGVTMIHDTLYNYAGDWHQDIAHRSGSPGPQATLTAGNRDFFESLMVDIASKLDVDDGTGSTYLDNALIMWPQESGVYSHDGTSTPIVTFGGAGGALKTGFYADYRNKVPSSMVRFEAARDYAGLTYNRWLAIVLQAMGVPRSEFERDGNQGYSQVLLGKLHKGVYVPGVVENASEIPRPLKA